MAAAEVVTQPVTQSLQKATDATRQRGADRLSTSQPHRTTETAVGLNRGDRRFVTFAAAITIALMAAHWVRITGWSPGTVEVERPNGEEYRFALDVNSASWVEWMQLDGIGEVLARRIVSDREQNGPFPDIESVSRVPGIGPKTMERIRPHLIASVRETEN